MVRCITMEIEPMNPLNLPALAVVVPCYNEAVVLPEFHRRMSAVLDQLGRSSRIVYVDDGSRDRTRDVMAELAAADPRVVRVLLARNFGKEVAMAAGLDHADAERVLLIDADLQDPPELLPDFLAKLDQGWDMVYGVRRSRAGESWLKRFTAAAFYRVIGQLSRTPIPADTGDFRVMSRRAVLALRRLTERQRFYKGLFGWVGYRQTGLEYDRDPRAAGQTKWNYGKLFAFAVDGITSFSTAPLRIATWVGVLTSLFSFVYGAWIISKTLLWGEPVRGYPTIMVTLLFLGGAQLMALGLIGEYLGRLFVEAKQRPVYLLDDVLGAESTNADASGSNARGA